MNFAAPALNLQAAWVGILLGFVTGMVLGLGFHREAWLGGYGSWQRRMYRLGHISFFGLGAVNLFFWLTLKSIPASGAVVAWASGLFVLGALTMPLCCAWLAHCPRCYLVFAVPVLSLIVAGLLTVGMVFQTEIGVFAQPQTSSVELP